MNTAYLDAITYGDCKLLLPLIDDDSVELLLSDIPYGIGLDEWDVLHANTNSALLGGSPAQIGKPAFKRRGKPINGWSKSDRDIGKEYQAWCAEWSAMAYPKMRNGASMIVFGGRRTIHRAVCAFEDCGFLLKDMLAWKKPSAHHRAQRVAPIFERRGMTAESKEWQGWRLGNMAPIFEPIAWLVKPYGIGGTIVDNMLANRVGAMNIGQCQINGVNPTNMLEFGFKRGETRIHEAQKPVELMEFLIRLTTLEGQTVLDPFIGGGTTAAAARSLNRRFIGFEANAEYHRKAVERLARNF